MTSQFFKKEEPRKIFSSLRQFFSWIFSIVSWFVIQGSSFFFLGWVLATLFFSSNWLDVLFALILVGIFRFFLLYLKGLKPKKIKITAECLEKIVVFLGSVSFLALLVNLYVGISPTISKDFQGVWGGIRGEWNKAALFLGVWLFLVFISLYCFAFLFLKIKEMKTFPNKAAKAVEVFFLVIVGLAALFVYSDFGKNFVYSLTSFLYEKAGWFFGMSLAGLHINYLISEIKKSLPAQVKEVSKERGFLQ